MSLRTLPTVSLSRTFRIATRQIPLAAPRRSLVSSSHRLAGSSSNGGQVKGVGRATTDHAKENETKRSGVPEEPEASDAPLASRSTPDLFSLRGRTVIITGGGRGLGLTIAEAVLESGGHVAALDLLPEPSQAEWGRAQHVAQQNGTTISYAHLDVTDSEQVHATFQRIFDSAPSSAPVRGLFTAAGIQLLRSAVEYKPEEVRKIIDVNLNGTFLCAQAFAKEFISRNPGREAQKTPSKTMQPASGTVGVDPRTGLAGGGGGSIVLTGSMSGHVANLGLECAAYNASKAGVNQLAKNFASEWGCKGIRVNSLSPGYIRTALTKALLDQRPDLNDTWLQGSLLGRLSTPDEFRGPVCYLLSDASSFMTGADMLVDGGHTAT